MTRWVTKDPITSLTGTESMPITQGGVDKQVSPAQLAAFIGGGGGSGDVSGPASSVDSHVALFDGTTGKLLKDGGALGGMSGINDAPSDGTGYVRKDGAWVAESGGGGSISAADVSFDNSATGATATDVQGAIDELMGDVATALAAIIGGGP